MGGSMATLFGYSWETCFLAEVFFFRSSLFCFTFDDLVVVWSLSLLRLLLESFSLSISHILFPLPFDYAIRNYGGVLVYSHR
jgi:hypothetical protein